MPSLKFTRTDQQVLIAWKKWNGRNRNFRRKSMKKKEVAVKGEKAKLFFDEKP